MNLAASLQLLLQNALPFFAIGIVAGLVSWGLTVASIGFAQRRRLLAEVNERSSHRVPTPRVGGIGLVAGIFVGFAVLAVMMAYPTALPLPLNPVTDHPRAFTWAQWGTMVAATLVAFAMGFWDDQSNPPAWAKLLGQAVIAVLPALGGWRLHEVLLPGMAAPFALPPWLGAAAAALWILVMMNVVNFMDGINGIAARFATLVAGATFFAAYGFRGFETAIPLAAGLWGGARGFLRENFPVARTFMGDCGSQPLGLVVALYGLHLASLPTTYPLPLLGFLLVVSVFVFDVGLTLVRRALRGENLMKAHREHLYQRHLIATGEDHGSTLNFVRWHFYFTGIAGVFYLHFGYDPAATMVQGICLAVTAVTLASYWGLVVWAERRRVPAS